MGTYIAQVQQHMVDIVTSIVASEKADVRFGLVRYRDFTDDFVTQVHPFTESLRTMKDYVGQMSANGGGDGPEAVASGLNALLSLDWRKESTKFVIFIADAPPHGLETSGDSYPNGGSDGIDPFVAARNLIPQEIIVYSVGCEPAINSYKYARDFMKAVADMTGGKYISLARANILADIIIGGAREEMNLENLAEQIEIETKAAKETGSYESEEKLYAEVATRLASRGVQTAQLKVDEVVPPSAFQYAAAFMSSASLTMAQAAIPSAFPPAAPSPFGIMSSAAPTFSAAPPSYGYPAPSPLPTAYPSALPAATSTPSFAYAPAPSPFSFGSSAAPPPFAYSSAPQPQAAATTVSDITPEQVQRLMSRKQQQQEIQRRG